jgi:hypothetical protein
MDGSALTVEQPEIARRAGDHIAPAPYTIQSLTLVLSRNTLKSWSVICIQL